MRNLYLLILALLVGCTKQHLESDNRLTITAISTDFDTKASETAFEAGDKIGVFLESSHGNNAIYETADGSTWRGYDNIYKVNPGEKATAYYPYSETATKQNAIEISKNVDFMITDATSITLDKNRASVALKFRHIFSKLAISIKIPEEIDGIKTVPYDSIVVRNVFRKCVVDAATGAISGLTDKGDISARSHEIIVIPQTIQKVDIICKRADGSFVPLAHNEPIELKTGKKTTLTAISNADLYFTSTLNLSNGDVQTDIPLSFYVAPGRTWTLTSSASWLTIEPKTGVGAATVKVSVAVNHAKPRTAVLTLADDKPSTTTLDALQNYAITVNINGIRWTTRNLTGTYQGQTDNFTLCANPQDYGMYWKWGSLFMYTNANSNYPAGHWGAPTTLWAATTPTAQSRGYDYVNLYSSWGAPVGDPCKSLGAYRTPTTTQWQNLASAGYSSITTYQGVLGRFFGKAATSCTNTTIQAGCIFLPAAGQRMPPNGEYFGSAVWATYWSSSVYDVDMCWLFAFNVVTNLFDSQNFNVRSYGLSVRCVAE